MRVRPMTRNTYWKGDCFQILRCPNLGHFQTWSMFEFIQVHVDCKHGWHGFDRTPKATVFLNQLDVPRTSQTYNVSLSPGMILSGHNFPKLSTFEVPKIFSEFFSPSFRLSSALRLPPRVRGLPRHDTAALGSLERPRRHGGAAPGGRGRRGCEGQHGPWPRRRIWGGKTSLRDGIPLWREREMKMLMVQIFWWMLFSRFIGKFAKTFAPMFGVAVFLWSPGFVLLEIGFVGRFFFRRGFLFGNSIGTHNPKIVFSVFGESALMRHQSFRSHFGSSCWFKYKLVVKRPVSLWSHKPGKFVEPSTWPCPLPDPVQEARSWPASWLTNCNSCLKKID